MSLDIIRQTPPEPAAPTFHAGADLIALNSQFRNNKPSEIIRFSIEQAKNPIIFTNFRPMAIAFLHLATQFKQNIPVIWVDHGFNTPETYRHISRVVEYLNLNLQVYSPKMSAAHYNRRSWPDTSARHSGP